MAFRTVLIESPSRCSYQGGYMVVRKEDGTVKVHLSEVESVVLHTHQAFISTYLLAELATRSISVVVSNHKHHPVGQYLPLHGAHNTSKRVQEQLEWSEPIKKRVWQRVVRDKIRMQAAVLEERGHVNHARALRAITEQVKSGDTTNREGYAARMYFSVAFGTGFSRDADLPVNAALNYGYAIILSMVSKEVVSRGYLTQRGICHRSEYNQFNFSCDLMEPFRPFVDRLVLNSMGEGFDKDIRLLLCDIASQKVVYRDGAYRLGSVMSLYVQDCVNALNRMIAPADIDGFSLYG
ncbi:type II CRISPR-associated endonuclease Cas1 [Eggerthellaceae bacterium zg-1084]|nr:type II CRISPR-associated endonuclease Cas1 [Berryella wangjianweii]